MHQAIFLAGFAAFAVASPTPQAIDSAPQVIDFAMVNAAPAPAMTGPPATMPDDTEQTVDGPCATQPDGKAPEVHPDTPKAFSNYPEFAVRALTARHPPSYRSTYKNLNASMVGNSYLGMETFAKYDVKACAKHCDMKDLCTGFNIFVERDPSQNPSSQCTNPHSITNYKCTFWGSEVNRKSATNYGQTRREFQVVIAGSNGYQKSVAPPVLTGWQPAQQCGSGTEAHQQAKTQMGQHFYPGPYNPEICAEFALEKNAQNSDDTQVTFFNSYMLKKNGKPMGTYCSLFDRRHEATEATYTPGMQGDDEWTIANSYTYALAK